MTALEKMIEVAGLSTHCMILDQDFLLRQQVPLKKCLK